MKTCIVSSCGGHLTEVRALRATYGAGAHFYVINDRILLPEDMEGRTYFIRHSERDWLFLANLWEAWGILRRERPDLILSTGAGPVVPFCLVGKLLSIPTIFIESFTRVTRLSLSGRIMHRLANRFFYQWRSLAAHAPRGAFSGPLFLADPLGDPRNAEPSSDGGPVFVTVGNATQGFDRLLGAVDRLAGEGAFAGRDVLLQVGNSAFRAAHCEQVPFLSASDFTGSVARAGLVISHAGVGTLFHVFRAGKIPIVMPRLKRYGEHVDDHQVELVQAMEREGWVVAAREPGDLPAAIARVRAGAAIPSLRSDPGLLAGIDEAIREVTRS